MIITGAELVVPAGAPGAQAITIDLQAILISEGRQDEVAIVTPQKAPELLAEFNRSWRELDKLVVRLVAEKTKAEKEAGKRRAYLLLYEIPALLAKMDVASTMDAREAVIALDPEFQALQETVDKLDAVIEYLKGKRKSFENSYTSVKKIMGEDTYNMRGRTNPNLSGGTEPRPRPGFGTPRY